jgi:dolichol-phosphate mannosyltransferase
MNSPTAPELSVILPSYEEAGNLRWLLPLLKTELSALDISFEILVVDTEIPRDKTPEICRENGVSYVPRLGGTLYSHALKTGISCATGRWILCMDSDGSHPPSFVKEMWAARNRADLVIASRYVKGGGTENPAVLIFLSYLVNLTFRMILGIRCMDLSNSFRLYQGGALRSLTLECRNFDIIEEILLKLSLRDADFSILELPFTFQTRKEGRTKRDLVAFMFSYMGTLRRLHRLRKSAMGKHP